MHGIDIQPQFQTPFAYNRRYARLINVVADNISVGIKERMKTRNVTTSLAVVYFRWARSMRPPANDADLMSAAHEYS